MYGFPSQRIVKETSGVSSGDLDSWHAHNISDRQLVAASGQSIAVNCGCISGDGLASSRNTSVLRFLLMFGLKTPKPHSVCHVSEESSMLSELNVIHKHALLQETHCVIPWWWQLWQFFMIKLAVSRLREVMLRLRSGLRLRKASPCPI